MNDELLALERRMRAERMLLDLDDPATLELVRSEVARVARAMDNPDENPPMLWTGIPFPVREQSVEHPSSGWYLVISVGGTKTEHALMRLEKGVVSVLERDGGEVRGEAVARVRASCRIPTPTDTDTADGHAMIEKIVEHVASRFAADAEALQRCRHVLLSWGFAHGAYRTGESIFGGLRAPSIDMTKGQYGFSADLFDLDVGGLFEEALARRLGWSRPVVVANDGVMALHYFLTASNLARYERFGLFINGTGSNFASAEPCAVRPEGIVSRAGERYEPERVTPQRPLAPGERLVPYFFNYETGSTALVGTRTPYDLDSEYPIEENALSGGNAFRHGLRSTVRACLGESVWASLCSDRFPEGEPHGPAVTSLAVAYRRNTWRAEIERIFPGSALEETTAERVAYLAGVVLSRSEVHAALLLAAITARTGFGLGAVDRSRADLLALEGSVWTTPGYADAVRAAWQRLVGHAPLNVELTHEEQFNASLPGPLYLAALHDR